MKKVRVFIPVSLFLILLACGHSAQPPSSATTPVTQLDNVNVGGAVTSFIRDSADFNREFGKEVAFCQFNFTGANHSGKDMAKATAASPNIVDMIANVEKHDIRFTILTTPVITDSTQLHGVADRFIAYVKRDPLFTGFKKYEVNIGIDGAPVQHFNY
ncbi:hypothetical protein [Chitinophaga eiseniae]|uniref:Lipoprotein n=1 Tax=Chitinophaga eiseniae TaxID=634771 RepID=A0A847SBH8_9BACT|nr:hypothetical protein [Chitinophaga eiseniae]NLR77474.1 hypothetical protein [Chitinophaga eiseniae]